MTDVVSECNKKFELCTGDELTGYCKEGYMGTLCETCDHQGVVWGQKYSNYGILEMKDCQKCTEIFKYLPAYILYFIFISCLIAFVINEGNSKIINHIQAKILSKSQIINLGITSFSGKSLMILKIGIFYMQILTSLVKFDIVFENSLKVAKFVPVYLISPIITMEFWMDCAISSIDVDVSIQYLRLFWTLFVFVMLLIGSMIAYLIYAGIVYKLYQFEQKRYVIIKYLSMNFFIFAFMFFFYISQHSILQNYMKILSCQAVGEKEYIIGQLNKECSDYEHSMWRILFVIPIFTIIGFVIPLYTAHHLYVNKKLLHNPLKISMIRQFGFFYFEYKPQFWYWEFLKLKLRILIIIFLNVFEEDIKKKGCFVLLVLMIYSLLAQKQQPYSLPQMNRLDKRANNITAFLIWLTVLSSNNQDSGQVDFALTLMTIIMIFFIIYLLLQFIGDFYFRYEDLFIKSRPIQFLLFYVGYLLSKERFQANNAFLLRKLPYLYRIIHCQHQLSFDHISRWRYLRSYIFDFGRRRRKDKFAQFYLIQMQATKNITNSTASTQIQNGENALNNNDSKKNGSINYTIESKKDIIGLKKNSEKVELIDSKKTGQQLQTTPTGDSFNKKQSLKQATTIRGEMQNLEKQQTAQNQILLDEDDEREEIIKKIYPVKRPMMFLYNSYSGMKIDNYKDAQVNDLCENPFYYHDYRMKYNLDTPEDYPSSARERQLNDIRYKVCLNKPEETQQQQQKPQMGNPFLKQTSRLEYPPTGQFLSSKDVEQEFENSMQDLSDIMSEDYNTRQIQEFRKKPIKESELISLSQDDIKNNDMINSPNSISYDYALSDFRLQSPHHNFEQQINNKQ